MSTIEKSIEINVPVRTAYQWTQFEEFPRFMEGVEEGRQLDESHLLWKAGIAGKDTQWMEDSHHEQRPDERIAWKSTDGARNAGVVTFHCFSDQKSTIMLQLTYDPEGAVEKVGDGLGAVSL